MTLVCISSSLSRPISAQRSHGTGRAAFTRSEITNVTRGLRVHSPAACLELGTLYSLLIGEEAQSQGLSPEARVLLSLVSDHIHSGME